MNRFLILLVILLGSFLYSLFWNQVRRPFCTDQTEEVADRAVVGTLPPVAGSDTVQLTPTEKPNP